MRTLPERWLVTLLVGSLGLCFPNRALAQDLEPRSYSASPVGTNFLAVGYAYQSGDVFVDSTVPIEDVEVSLNGTVLLYGRTFGLASRQANVAATFPYAWGTVSGKVFEEHREVTRSGAADMRIRFSMNLRAGTAMTPREFVSRKPTTTFGASLTIVAPTGQYDPAKLVNIGANRWAFKPEFGVSHPKGPWTLEGAAGLWIFKNNDNFFGGSRLEQKPLASLQGNASYTFRPRLWVAAGATYFFDGRTVVDDVAKETYQRNSRFGTTLSLPLNQRQSVKVSWMKGLTTRVGGNLNTVAFAWQYVWF